MLLLGKINQLLKNPGRVTWGKKLAKMSKDLKNKKKTCSTEEFKFLKKILKLINQQKIS